MADASKQAPSILIVDDTLANLSLLSGVLKQHGYRVRPVPDGELALKAARSAPPDLVLLDVNMPGLNGFEVCERLKADPALKEIPVIFISALNEVLDKVRAFKVGGVDYVTKPFQIEEVLARVATHWELRKGKRALQESYERLRELEMLRDSLVHMVVHDLRTPLAAIQALLGFLEQDAALSEESLDDVRQAHVATKKMTLLISSLLDASKLEAGKMKLRYGPCNLNDLIGKTLHGLRPLVGRRRLVVDPTSEPATASADSEVVARVIQNLVSNALKYSPPEGEIRFGTHRVGEAVKVTISDQGPGIPVQFRLKIFEKFGQVEARQQNVPSTGLGLPFCKLAVEAHGGRVGVDCVEGAGSTFWFEIPLERPRGGAEGGEGGE